MADDFKKMEAKFDKIEKKEMREYTVAKCKNALADLIAAHRTCESIEEELIKLLPAARKNGVNGDDLRSFLRDAAFKKVYKELDKSVDTIDAAEKKLSTMTTQAAFLENDLKVQLNALSRAFPKSNDKSVVSLANNMKNAIDDLKAASGVYEPRGKHKKMREYATKFEKNVEKILDLAPPADKREEIELPKELDPSAIETAKKDIQKLRKEVLLGVKKVMSIIEAYKPYTNGADRLVKRDSGEVNKRIKVFEKLVLDYDKRIAGLTRDQLKAFHGNDKPDLKSFQSENKNISKEINGSVEKMIKAASDARKTLG
jgi:hypothetical protein